MHTNRMHDDPRRRPGRRLAALITGAVMLTSGSLAVTALPAAAADDCSTVAWMDTSQSSEDRANALLDASSQHQKYRWLVEQPANDPQRTTWSGGVVYPVQVPCTPVVIYANGPDGVLRTGGHDRVARADRRGIHLEPRTRRAEGRSHTAASRSTAAAPSCSARASRSGRTPLVGSRLGVLRRGRTAVGPDGRGERERASSSGNPDKPVVANLKHYVANEQETDREESSSNMDERTLRQVYDLPYEIAVEGERPRQRHVLVQPGQRRLRVREPDPDHEPRPADGLRRLRDERLRVGALHRGVARRGARPGAQPPRLLHARAARRSPRGRRDHAGADRPGRVRRRAHVHRERACSTTRFRRRRSPNVSTPEHKALAREIAEQSTVLLKNDGVLPLADDAPDCRRHRPDRRRSRRPNGREREDRLRLVPRLPPRAPPSTAMPSSTRSPGSPSASSRPAAACCTTTAPTPRRRLRSPRRRTSRSSSATTRWERRPTSPTCTSTPTATP